LKEKHDLKNLGIQGRIILKWISKKLSRRTWIRYIWVRMDGDNATSCEHVNEHSGSIKCTEFLEYLDKFWLLKKKFSPWR
jgi:hypothetical protein